MSARGQVEKGSEREVSAKSVGGFMNDRTIDYQQQAARSRDRVAQSLAFLSILTVFSGRQTRKEKQDKDV